MHKTILTLTSICLAITAHAHSGVENPSVMARMHQMDQIKDATRTLGAMAQGQVAFDPTQAQSARLELQTLATAITRYFESNETDPKSEALPTIWTDWTGFVAAAQQMEAAVDALDADSLDSLRAGMQALGQSCSACHKTYRAP